MPHYLHSSRLHETRKHDQETVDFGFCVSSDSLRVRGGENRSAHGLGYHAELLAVCIPENSS